MALGRDKRAPVAAVATGVLQVVVESSLATADTVPEVQSTRCTAQALQSIGPVSGPSSPHLKAKAILPMKLNTQYQMASSIGHRGLSWQQQLLHNSNFAHRAHGQ